MKILVTGSNGQLGMAIRQASSVSDHEFIFTDLQELDITDPKKVEDVVAGVDVVVNCAAYTDVNKAESDQDTAMLINAVAVGYLAQASEKAGALLIHISTDYIFDGKAPRSLGNEVSDGVIRPYKEDDQPLAVNAYGASKYAGERAIEESGCRYMIFRSAWLYSQYGRNFVKTILEKAADNAILKVVCDQVGTPTNANDLAELIVYIIDSGQLEKTGVYNYTNEGVCSWYDLAREVCLQSGYLCDVLPCFSKDYPTPAQRPMFSLLDKAKVKETFGIEIPHWRDSLQLCMAELL